MTPWTQFLVIIMLSGMFHAYRLVAPRSRHVAIALFSRRVGRHAPKDPAYRLPKPPATTAGVAAVEEAQVKDRPFTLPPGEHRPKQSLGQNYLSDQNYVLKICDAFQDDSEEGSRVVEIGPGMGALTRVLVRKYPKMTAIEVDKRSVRFLNEKLPGLNVIHDDVLKFDWAKLAEERGGKLNVIANLPYYITSQVLFGLADAHQVVGKAVVTMQWEVGERVTATPGNKDYGIPSVVFQLYGKTQLNFKIPPKVFFPVPKVDSALVTIDFTKPHKNLQLVEPEHLRKVVTLAFRQRRKMLRQSLKDLLVVDGLTLPEKWATLRPEQVKPAQFLELTLELYGKKGSETSERVMRAERGKAEAKEEAKATAKKQAVVRKEKIEASKREQLVVKYGLVDGPPAPSRTSLKTVDGGRPKSARLLALLQKRAGTGGDSAAAAAATVVDGDRAAQVEGEQAVTGSAGNSGEGLEKKQVERVQVRDVWRKPFAYPGLAPVSTPENQEEE